MIVVDAARTYALSDPSTAWDSAVLKAKDVMMRGSIHVDDPNSPSPNGTNYRIQDLSPAGGDSVIVRMPHTFSDKGMSNFVFGTTNTKQTPNAKNSTITTEN